MPDTFHFLRPEWFIAIPFVAVLLILRLKRSSQKSGWEDICDPELLRYQLGQKAPVTAKKPTTSLRLFNWTIHFLLPFIFLISIFSLAGPSWEKKDQPVFQQGNALVIILDLSLSMNAKDLKPSRLERAKLKLIDILQQKKEGQTALIAFAGDAHVVSPLTIDNKTIMSLLPSLESSIMPLTGSHLIDALTTAKQLFKSAGFAQGDILLLSDGIDSSQQNALQKSVNKIHQQGYRFSVIGVGSQAGSPIPMPGQGGFIKDQSGQVVLSKLTPEPLKKLASIGGGSYYKLSLDDSDFDELLNQQMDQDNNLTDKDKQLEQWVDAGAYFTLLLIPLALLSFRKGLLSFVLCLSIAASFVTEPSYADAGTNEQLNKQVKKHWQQLWSTPDQQGQKSFAAKDYQTAADHFSDQKWKASAYYRAGDYEKALQQYTQSDDAVSLYNKGNSLANLNQFQEAIEAYEQVLNKAPEASQSIKKNASENLEYLKELLAQQNKQSAEKNSDKSNESSDQPAEDQKQQKNSDDSSKSDTSESDESEQNNSKDSNSEGADSEEQEPQSADPENDEHNDSTQENQDEENEPQSPDAAKPVQEQEKDQEEDSKQQASTQAEPVDTDESNQENADSTPNDVLSQLSQEEQQSLKQWLQRIPDNPGQLLRIKFRNNTLLKQRQPGSTDAQYEGNPW